MRQRYITPESFQQMMHMQHGAGLWGAAGLGGSLGEAQEAPAPISHAVSIRTDLCLHKTTLRAVASAEHPELLSLEFEFNADVPVEIRVFHVGVFLPSAAPAQDASGQAAPITSQLAFRAAPSSARAFFAPGMFQTFSQAAGAGAGAGSAAGSGSGSFSSSNSLDVRHFTLQELTHVPPSHAAALSRSSSKWRPGDSSAGLGPSGRCVGALAPPSSSAPPADMYPLIVSLRACDASGVPVLPVKMQATFCTLELLKAAPSGSSEWVVKPLLQQVQLGEQRFTLRDFFGGSEGSSGAASSSSPSSSDSSGSAAQLGRGGTTAAMRGLDEQAISGSECVICLTEKRTTAVLPCRHLCLCAECAQQLAFQSNKCPICRGPCASLLAMH